MEFNLNQLKNLRERGATVQMQDDVANFVGGYDSTLFYPTVDFILTIQNAARQSEIDQSVSLDLQAVGLPKVYDPAFFEKVSIKASRDAVQNGDLPDGMKQQVLDYLDNIEIQRADLLGVLGLEPDVIDSELIYNPRGLKPTRKPRGSASHIKSLFRGLIDKMRKLNLRVIANKEIQLRQQQDRQTILQKLKYLVQKTVFRETRLRSANRERLQDGLLEARVASGIADDDDYDRDRREDKSQETRMDGKPIEDVAHQHEQAMEKFSGEVSVHGLQAGEEKKKQEMEISKDINQMKQADKESKKASDKPQDQKNKEVQKIVQRENARRSMRLRIQQNVNQVRQKAAQKKQSDQNVKNMSGHDAVKNLKDMGFSSGGTVSATKLHNEEHEKGKETDLHK